MKAILTRYHVPTNTKGARISAVADGWGRVYAEPGEGHGEESHWPAAEKLLLQGYKYRRNRTEFVAGTLADGSVVFVFRESEIFVLDDPKAVQS